MSELNELEYGLKQRILNELLDKLNEVQDITKYKNFIIKIKLSK